jgi:tetratricopeptide (TPR) repeat protein
MSRLARFGAQSTPFNPAQAAALKGELGEALGLTPQLSRFALRIAAEKLGRGKAEEAFNLYFVLAAANPLQSDVQLGLANCALALGREDLAARSAAAAIALDPENYKAYAVSGRANLVLKKKVEAMEDFRDAERLAEAAGDAAVLAHVRSFIKKLEAFGLGTH